MRTRRRIDSSAIIAHPVSLRYTRDVKWSHYTSLDIPREGSREYYARTRYIAIYVYIYVYREINPLNNNRCRQATLNHVATSEWHTVKICQHSHNRLIDNIGDYLYFKNQRMGASNLKLIHISSTWDCTTFHNFLPMFQKKKEIFKNWQVYDWRTKWLIMSGYMDLRRPRVYRRSNVGLVKYVFQWIPCVWRHD